MNDAGRIGFVIKGEYNNTETYDFLDVVYYNNSSYVAKKLTVGNPPADNNEYWHALAKVPGSTVLGVKGNAESTYRTGNINITPENIGAVSNEYISENFVPGYVSTVRTTVKDTGWYRIAQVQSLGGYSCVISLKRRYNLPAPEYQKVQFLRAYTNVKFVPIASISESHIWTKMRMTRDNADGKDYIEVYQNVNSNSNMWVVTIEDALGTVAADHWKAMPPELTQESADGVTIVASVNLPANLDLDFYAKKDGSNVTGTWSNLTAGNAIKATQDSNGNVIRDTYLPLSGGTVTGNLRLKGSGNYGNKLNFGDSDYVHISEPTDDHLEIQATYINFVTNTQNVGHFTLNGKNIALAESIPNIQHGYKTISLTANVLTEFSISFEKNFSSNPNVVFTSRHNSKTSTDMHKIKTITTSGFTGQIISSGGGGYAIEWIAIGS